MIMVRHILPVGFIGGVILLTTLACAPSLQTPEVPDAQKHVAEVHRAKCGNCHVRVEPGTHTQAELETALTRHRKRVHLSEEEWSELVSYLAQPTSG
jgi:hypothetical protein